MPEKLSTEEAYDLSFDNDADEVYEPRNFFRPADRLGCGLVFIPSGEDEIDIDSDISESGKQRVIKVDYVIDVKAKHVEEDVYVGAAALRRALSKGRPIAGVLKKKERGKDKFSYVLKPFPDEVKDKVRRRINKMIENDELEESNFPHPNDAPEEIEADIFVDKEEEYEHDEDNPFEVQ